MVSDDGTDKGAKLDKDDGIDDRTEVSVKLGNDDGSDEGANLGFALDTK